jgi:hypothetical protein
MTNIVSASAPFELNALQLDVAMPAIFLAATDGCFSYLDTPADFEYLLLKSLHSAQAEQDWQDRLKAAREYAADDRNGERLQHLRTGSDGER